MDKIDFLEKNLARQLAWIRAADTRMSLVLPLATAMLGALAAVAPSSGEWCVADIVVSTLAAVPLVGSLACCAFSSFPRTDGPKGSLIYFGGIASKEVEEFRSSVRKLTDEYYVSDLSNQCHVNAAIAKTKFLWIKRAMAALFAATIPWGVAVLTLYGN